MWCCLVFVLTCCAFVCIGLNVIVCFARELLCDGVWHVLCCCVLVRMRLCVDAAKSLCAMRVI